MGEDVQLIKTYTQGRIQNIRKLHPESKRRATLAILRRGVGRNPGENPEAWGIVLERMPYKLYNSSGKLSAAEIAVYNALTLYALHQMGNDLQLRCMHHEGIALGNAVSRLGEGDERGRIWNRFRRVIAASDINEAVYFLRSLIPLLRNAGIGLDYGELALDLYFFQYEKGAVNVRNKWSKSFYHTTEVLENNNE